MQRIPMIQFRYGVRNAVQSVASSSPATPAAAVAVAVRRPRQQIPDEEIDVINLGGASAYPVAKKR
jgi:hypothetical protein